MNKHLCALSFIALLSSSSELKSTYSITDIGNYVTASGFGVVGGAGFLSTVAAPRQTEQFLLWLDKTKKLSPFIKENILTLLNPIMVPLRDSLSEEEKERLRTLVEKVGLDGKKISFFEEPTETSRADSITCSTIGVSRDLLHPKREMELEIRVGYAAATIKNHDHAKVSLMAVAAPWIAKGAGMLTSALLKKGNLSGLHYYTRIPLVRALVAWLIFCAWSRSCYLASEKDASEKLETTLSEIAGLKREIKKSEYAARKQGIPARFLRKLTSLLSYVMIPFPSAEASLTNLQSLPKQS